MTRNKANWPGEEIVVTSRVFLAGDYPVLAIYTYSSGASMFLTHYEQEFDEPIYVHFSDLLKVDNSLCSAPRVRRSISLRVAMPDGELSDWVVYRWMSDQKIDKWKQSGRIDEEYEKLLASLT